MKTSLGRWCKVEMAVTEDQAVMEQGTKVLKVLPTKVIWPMPPLKPMAILARRKWMPRRVPVQQPRLHLRALVVHLVDGMRIQVCQISVGQGQLPRRLQAEAVRQDLGIMGGLLVGVLD